MFLEPRPWADDYRVRSNERRGAYALATYARIVAAAATPVFDVGVAGSCQRYLKEP
jgi:hypothetical protein